MVLKQLKFMVKIKYLNNANFPVIILKLGQYQKKVITVLKN